MRHPSLLVFGLIVMLHVPSLYADGIQWRNSFLDALNESERTKQHMFVQITADWCNYCKKMDNSTLADPDIVKLINSSFIPVKVDADEQKTLTQRIKVQYVPSSVVISADRKILAKLAGFQSADKLKQQLPRFEKPLPVTSQPLPNSDNGANGAVQNNEPSAAAPMPVKPAAEGTQTRPQLVARNETPAVQPPPMPTNAPVGAKNQPFELYSQPPVAIDVQKPTDSPSAQTTAPQKIAPPTPAANPETVRQTAAQDKSQLERPEYSFGRVCLCSLLDEQTMVMGSKQFSHEYKGAKLCFASQEHLGRFVENPKRYWPAWGGVCAHSLRFDATLVEGSPTFGAVFQDRLWFFATQEKKDAFTAEPRSFLPKQND